MWSSSSSEDEGEKETRALPASHFDRAKLNVLLTEKEVSFDENETPLIPSREEEESEKPVSARSKAAKRNIVMLSSDEEEEVKTHNTSPWTEEEDRMLRWLLENYDGIVDPWGMVAYDSFFLKARRSQRNVMQRSIELGLLDANAELPEESDVEKEESEESEQEEKEEKEESEQEEKEEKEEEEEDNTEDPSRLERDSQSSEERAALIRTNLASMMKRIPQANKLSMLTQFVY